MWSLLAKICMLAYVVLLLVCVARGLPALVFALFAALLIVGVYAEYRADRDKRPPGPRS